MDLVAYTSVSGPSIYPLTLKQLSLKNGGKLLEDSVMVTSRWKHVKGLGRFNQDTHSIKDANILY